MNRKRRYLIVLAVIVAAFVAVIISSVQGWVSVRHAFRQLSATDIPILYRASEVSLDISQARTELFRYVNKYEPSPFRIRKSFKQVQDNLLWISRQQLPQNSKDLAGALLASIDQFQKMLNLLEFHVKKGESIHSKLTINRLAGSATTLLSLSGKLRDHLWDDILHENEASQKKLLRNNAVLAGISLILIMMLVFGVLFQNRVLQREVQSRTAELQERLYDLHQSEMALRESEEKFSKLFQASPVYIAFTVLDDGCFLEVNDAFTEVTGYQKNEVLGRTPVEIGLWPDPEERGIFLKLAQEYDGFREKEVRFLKKNGELLLGLWSAEKVKLGAKTCLISVLVDITERRRIEEALHESKEKLARSKKMEAMGLMAGGIAHDLNNILSGIVSYPELLLMDLPKDSPLRKPIKTIQESGMRAADVVEDLLTIARGVASGKEVLNLNSVVQEYLDSAEHLKLERIHPLCTFKTDLDSQLLNISCSASHAKKILMNLIANASEAIEDKGTVTVSTMNRYLDEPLKGYEDVRKGEYVVLGVSDDGSGISPQDLDRIFEPFYTKKVMGRSGTGLGLAVVWNTVQNHSGYINVESSEKGTVFELYFPTTREQVAGEKEQVPLEDYLGHGEKILVVDDEERQREIASGILTRLGYNAETVSSGEAAIEYVKEHPVDLILLDMVMPKGINGRKTYEEIIKIHPGQKAIIASGYAKTKEVDKAQELGAGKYIKKPYTLAKVGLAVKEELEK